MKNTDEIILLEEILARLMTVRDGWEHKSKWNQKLGTTFLDYYIDDYKDRLEYKLLSK